ATALAQELDECIVPDVPRKLVSDCTPEKLATLLAKYGGSLAILDDEGVVFEILGGRYSREPNLEVFLKAHAGSRLIVDRGTRTEIVERPALTQGLAVQ